jgi:hypothetical protein
MPSYQNISTLKPLTLSQSEEVKACCAIAREKLELGDYEAGCAALQRWWTLGEWPRQMGLDSFASAELLLVTGTLSGWVASSKTHGRRAEACRSTLKWRHSQILSN